MTGFDVYRQAKTLYPDIAVVLVTGHGSPEVVSEANRMGFDSILLKPFTSEELRGPSRRCSRTASRTRADAVGRRGNSRPGRGGGHHGRRGEGPPVGPGPECCPWATASSTTPSSSASGRTRISRPRCSSSSKRRARRAAPRRARARRRLRPGQLHLRARRGRLLHHRPGGLRGARRAGARKAPRQAVPTWPSGTAISPRAPAAATDRSTRW